MGTFAGPEEAQAFFENDRFATVNGMRINELTEDGCVCSMDIREDHRNGLGGVMGGVIFTLADFAFAVASNQIWQPTTGQTCSISYLNGVKGSRLLAEARCVKNGRGSCVINVDVRDDLDRHIAQFTGTGYKLPGQAHRPS